MTHQLKFTVPRETVGKGRPRSNRKTGVIYTPEQTVRFENLVSYVASQAMTGRALFEGPLIVSMITYVIVPASWSNKRRTAALSGLEIPVTKPDGDNIMKITDALNGVVFADDKQIANWQIRKFYANTPRLEISVSTYF